MLFSVMLGKSFWQFLKEMYTSIEAELFYIEPKPDLGLPIHPSASELAEDMLVDPDALKNETYEPGIYDETGDYYPQFTDDPSKMPDYIEPNPLGGAVPEPNPASDSKSDVSAPAETDNADS